MLLKFFKGFRSLIETAKAASTVSLKPPKPLPRSHWNRGIRFRGLSETAKAASAISLIPLKPKISNNYLKFLGDFEAICKTTLAPESGPYRGDCLMKKNRGSKISWHCPFKVVFGIGFLANFHNILELNSHNLLYSIYSQDIFDSRFAKFWIGAP
jgi:hypothetical protein